MKKASELIDQFFSAIETEHPGEKEYVSLFQSWERIAGTDLAAHCRILEIERNSIMIEADHPGWSQLLSMKKNQILAKIQQQYPELGITTLRLMLRNESKG